MKTDTLETAAEGATSSHRPSRVRSNKHASTPARASAAPPRTPPTSEYISQAETRALMGNSLAARNTRLAAADLISTEDAAELTGTSRVTVNDWIAKGRCIGLSQTKRGFRLPHWQFEPNFWPLVPKLFTALGTREGWSVLAFLESPHGALQGITPRVAIEQGHGERVIAVAEHEGN